MNWFDASPAWLFRLLSTPSSALKKYNNYRTYIYAGNPLSNVHERVGLRCNVTSQWQSSRSERYAEFEEKKQLFSMNWFDASPAVRLLSTPSASAGNPLSKYTSV